MDLSTADRYLALFPDESGSTTPRAARVTQINMRIASVSAVFERYLQRKTENAEYIDKFPAETGSGTNRVQLRGFPVESVTTVAIFGSDLESDEYLLDAETGVIEFAENVRIDEELIGDAITVTYTGGMADDAADFATKYPDLEIALLTQVNFELVRQQNITKRSLSIDGATEGLNPFGLIASIAETLDRHRRIIWP